MEDPVLRCWLVGGGAPSQAMTSWETAYYRVPGDSRTFRKVIFFHRNEKRCSRWGTAYKYVRAHHTFHPNIVGTSQTVPHGSVRAVEVLVYVTTFTPVAELKCRGAWAALPPTQHTEGDTGQAGQASRSCTPESEETVRRGGGCRWSDGAPVPTSALRFIRSV